MKALTPKTRGAIIYGKKCRQSGRTIAKNLENLWAEMKMMVRRRTPPPSNIRELEKYVKSAWKDIPPEYYKKLIDSMPRRIKAVIAANGNRIKY